MVNGKRTSAKTYNSAVKNVFRKISINTIEIRQIIEKSTYIKQEQTDTKIAAISKVGHSGGNTEGGL